MVEDSVCLNICYEWRHVDSKANIVNWTKQKSSHRILANLKKIIWLRARMGVCQSGLCPRTPWTSTECRARWRWDAPSSAISEDDRIKCSSIPSTTPIYRRSCLNELALDNKHMSTDPPEVDVVQQVVACAARDAVLVQLQTRGSLRMRVRILFHYMWQDMAIDIGSPVGTCGAGGGVPGSTVCPCAAHMPPTQVHRQTHGMQVRTTRFQTWASLASIGTFLGAMCAQRWAYGFEQQVSQREIQLRDANTEKYLSFLHDFECASHAVVQQQQCQKWCSRA